MRRFLLVVLTATLIAAPRFVARADDDPPGRAAEDDGKDRAKEEAASDDGGDDDDGGTPADDDEPDDPRDADGGTAPLAADAGAATKQSEEEKDTIRPEDSLQVEGMDEIVQPKKKTMTVAQGLEEAKRAIVKQHYEEALKLADEFLQRETTNLPLWRVKAEALLALGHARKAAAAYDRIASAGAGEDGALLDRVARGMIREGLHESYYGVRAAAARALGELKERDAIPDLKDALGDLDVRFDAAEALAKMNDLSGQSVLEKSLTQISKRDRAAAALAKLPAGRGLPALRKAAASTKAYVKIASAKALARAGDPAGIPALRSALREDDPAIRLRAVQALGDVGDPTTAPVLREALLTDRSAKVRIEAAETLALLGDKSGVPSLGGMLTDPDAETRIAAAESLGKIGSKEAIPQLKSALESENGPIKVVRDLEAGGDKLAFRAIDEKYAVRIAIAGALGRLGEPDAAKTLQEAIAHGEDLSRITLGAGLESSDAAAAAAVVAALQRGAADVRGKAAMAMGKLGQQGGVPAVNFDSALHDKDPRARASALEAIARLGNDAPMAQVLAATLDPSSAVRAAAYLALGGICKPTQLPALRRGLVDPDGKVRVTAARAVLTALGRLKLASGGGTAQK